MNARTLKRLASALVALLVVWLALGLTRRASKDTAGRLSLVPFDPASVEKATIIKGADTMHFVRQGLGWSVNGFPANATYVGEMLRAMADTNAQSELVAENASSHKQLGLDSSNARRVSVQRGGKVLSELFIGSRGGSYGSVYVRKPGDNASYQLKGQLADMGDHQLDDWRDKVIAKIEPESVAVIDVQRNAQEYHLTRGDKGWSLADGAADSAAVAGLVNQFRNLEAAGFATPAQSDSANFTPADRRIRVAAKGDRPLVVVSMDSTATGFWVRREGDATTYRLDSWIVNQLTPADSTLRKK